MYYYLLRTDYCNLATYRSVVEYIDVYCLAYILWSPKIVNVDVSDSLPDKNRMIGTVAEFILSNNNVLKVF